MMKKEDMLVLKGTAKVLSETIEGQGKEYPFYTQMGGNAFNFLYFTKKPLGAAIGDKIKVRGWQKGSFRNKRFGLFVFEMK